MEYLIGILLLFSFFGLVVYAVRGGNLMLGIFVMGVIWTVLPMTITVLAATALILAHFYALSLPIALVALVIFILMYIFYFRFTPKKAWLVLISGLAFSLKIPFVIPIAFGLLGSPVWIVPASAKIRFALVLPIP